MRFVLIPVCFLIAALFVCMVERRHYVMGLILKGLASLVFVLFGILSGASGRPAAFVLIGLALGAVADVLLDLHNAVGHREICFSSGVFVFFLGHIAYFIAVLPKADQWLPCIIITLFAAGLLILFVMKQLTAPPFLLVGGCIYVTMLVLVNVSAVLRFIAGPSLSSGMFMTGALFFLTSDTILILDGFGKKGSRLSGRIALIVFYYAAQVLIALSIYPMR